MKQKSVVILGGGISGLATAWFFQRTFGDTIHVTIVEKSSRLGGWIRTVEQNSFLFEQGPRGCRSKGSGLETLKLIEQAGLEGEVIVADANAKKRYLWVNDKLQKIPSGPFSFLFSSLTKGVMGSLFRERSIERYEGDDETVYDFICRRFNSHIAETFVDPLVLGIFAGNPHKLSMRSCFPAIHQWEQEYGSVMKGAFAQRKGRSQEGMSEFVRRLQKGGIFSFKEGMESFVTGLAKRIHAEVLLDTTVQALRFTEEGAEVDVCKANEGRVLRADYVVSALPSNALAALFSSLHPSIAQQLRSVTSASVAVVNFGYDRAVMPKSGFGHLIPTQEQEEVLGVVWDSCVFPQQNRHSAETRLSVMIGGDQIEDFSDYVEQDCIEMALRAVSKHLKIKEKPKGIAVRIAQQAIPQYYVGHTATIQSIEMQIKKHFPRLTLLGNSFYGVGVNDCIIQAKKVVDRYLPGFSC